MVLVSGVIFYFLMFLAVYVQVFFLVTFLENRGKILIRHGKIKLSSYPPVTIIVPCWNEEKTILKTVHSLLDLNYPKDKLKVMLVDDGSTDGTWNVIQRFKDHKNIEIFRKPNGGKYTVLNMGIEKVTTDFFGCLDADSIVDGEALVRMMDYFARDKDAMAVTPSIIVHNPKNIIQQAQKIEYYISVFAKRMLGFLGAIHVTPGPFTIFKKEVFDKLGPYNHAHNTEDMEIAYRMQKNHYKIDYCNDAYVYTNTPNTIKKLYKQRLRWIYGFINNTIDYRDVLLKKKYGNFSMFTVPAGIVSVFTVSFMVGKLLLGLVDFIVYKIIEFRTVGIDMSIEAAKPDFYFFNTEPFVFLTLLIYSLVIFSIIFGHKMIEGKWKLSAHTISFFLVFSMVAPFWLMTAIYNTVMSQKPAWR